MALTSTLPAGVQEQLDRALTLDDIEMAEMFRDSFARLCVEDVLRGDTDMARRSAECSQAVAQLVDEMHERRRVRRELHRPTSVTETMLERELS